MTSDDSSIFLEQYCHLRLGQPNSFIFHSYINGCLPIVCLINNNLIVFHDLLV